MYDSRLNRMWKAENAVHGRHGWRVKFESVMKLALVLPCTGKRINPISVTRGHFNKKESTNEFLAIKLNQ